MITLIKFCNFVSSDFHKTILFFSRETLWVLMVRHGKLGRLMAFMRPMTRFGLFSFILCPIVGHDGHGTHANSHVTFYFHNYFCYLLKKTMSLMGLMGHHGYTIHNSHEIAHGMPWYDMEMISWSSMTYLMGRHETP